jgi:putative effector of murein hydrolase LrgA (UPF0299 family)
MLHAIALLLVCQLAGETAAHFLSLPIPGPVIGMVLLLAALLLRVPLPSETQSTSEGLLRHLSLLFVPAGVGVVQQLDFLGEAGPRLVALVVLTAIIALAATALTFAGIARLMGITGEENKREEEPQ